MDPQSRVVPFTRPVFGRPSLCPVDPACAALAAIALRLSAVDRAELLVLAQCLERAASRLPSARLDAFPPG